MKTLCWDCKNCIGKCPWSESFTPVEGWQAIPHRIKVDKNDSFIVLSCPLFEGDYKPVPVYKIIKQYHISYRTYFRWLKLNIITKDGKPIKKEYIEKHLKIFKKY